MLPRGELILAIVIVALILLALSMVLWVYIDRRRSNQRLVAVLFANDRRRPKPVRVLPFRAAGSGR